MDIYYPKTLLEFQRIFPDEAACAAYLENVRWPSGFSCSACGVHDVAQRMTTRPRILRCRHCRNEVSLTAGTMMHATKTPLQVWFWGAHLVTTQTPGMSALQFQRQLGISRYETAFQLLHKLRSGMVRPDQDPIGGDWWVEADETLVGGKTRGEGHGVHHMTYVVGVVDIRESIDKHGGKNMYAGRIRLQVLDDRTGESLEAFVSKNVAPHSHITTDGWSGYSRLNEMGYKHTAVALDGDMKKAEQALPTIHLVFSNLKTWLLGTHHGLSRQHLPAYLIEFVFRFNRRFNPMSTFASLLGIGMNASGPTYRQVYDGLWDYQAHAPIVDTP